MPPKPRSESWKTWEDELLCEARLMFANDPEHGVNQKDNTLWEIIVSHYEKNRPEGSVSRNKESCNTRWKKISKECMAYSAALSKAEVAHSSGQNNTDTTLLAESNYFKATNKPWKLKHCWAILQNEPKFQNPPEFGSPMSLDVDDTPQSVIGPSSSGRPAGTSAKKKARSKKDQPIGRSKQMDEYLEWTKEQEIEARAIRAKEFAIVRDDLTMQVNPNDYTPKKKLFWERRQKIIMDRELADVPPSSSQPSSNTARNLYGQPEDTNWIPLDSDD